MKQVLISNLTDKNINIPSTNEWYIINWSYNISDNLYLESWRSMEARVKALPQLDLVIINHNINQTIAIKDINENMWQRFSSVNIGSIIGLIAALARNNKLKPNCLTVCIKNTANNKLNSLYMVANLGLINFIYQAALELQPARIVYLHRNLKLTDMDIWHSCLDLLYKCQATGIFFDPCLDMDLIKS